MPKDPQQSIGLDILASDFDWFGTATGGTAYAVTMDGVGTSYNEGRLLAFRAGSASVGTATLSINSIGAKEIKIWGASGLGNPNPGEIAANQIVVVTYDSVNDCFVMLSNPAEINTTQSVSVSVSGTGNPLFLNDAGVINVTLQRAARLLLQFAGTEQNRTSNGNTQSFQVVFAVNTGTVIGYSVGESANGQGDGGRPASCTTITSLLPAGTHTVNMRIAGQSTGGITRGIQGTLYATILKQ